MHFLLCMWLEVKILGSCLCNVKLYEAEKLLIQLKTLELPTQS